MSKKNTKRALLSSVLALVLCFAMLTGTTFAWFTDSVTSGKNQIVAGNLDVELYHGKGEPTTSVDANTENIFTDINGETIKWEPGVVSYTNLKVVNEGNLALKYILGLNVIDATASPISGATLAEVLKVAVVKGGFAAGTTRDDIITDTTLVWNNLASFTKDGKLTPKDSNLVVPGASKESETWGIVIYWEPSDRDNDFNMNNGNKGTELKVDLGIRLYATQLMAEDDSFGNDYDNDAEMPGVSKWDGVTVTAPTADANGVYHITNAAELAGVNLILADLPAEESAHFVLETNVDLDGHDWTPLGVGEGTGECFTGTFDGNGYTVYNLYISGATTYAASATLNDDVGFFGVVKFTSVIKNLTLANVDVNGGERVGALVGKSLCGSISNCHVVGGSVKGAEKVGGLVGHFDSATLSQSSVTNLIISGEEKVGGLAGRTISAYGAVAVKNNSVTNTDISASAEASADAFVGQDYYGNTTMSGNKESEVTLYQKEENSTVYVYTAEDLAALSGDGMKGVKRVALMADIDFTGYTWIAVDNHVDRGFVLREFDGNGYTISNMNVTGAGIFKRIAGLGSVVIKNLKIDNAKVDSGSGVNVGILVGALYDDLLLENVDISNSTVSGNYKVASLVGAVYDENPNSTVTLTVKDCDISGCTVNSRLDFMACGMVAFVYVDDGEKVVFENCTLSDTTVKSTYGGYDANALVYSVDGIPEGCYNTVEGVTVTNCSIVVG